MDNLWSYNKINILSVVIFKLIVFLINEAKDMNDGIHF